MQQNITGREVYGALIFATIGFVFRLGLIYRECRDKGKKPPFASLLFLGVFSYGSGALMFVVTVEQDWENWKKLVLIFSLSFFGNVLVPGIGGIKSSFFKKLGESLIKDIARKVLNIKNSDEEIEYDNEESKGNVEQ